MNNSEEVPGKLRISSAGGLGRLGRLALTLLVVLGILMVTGYFAAGTEGGKAFIRDHLAKRLGMEISVGAASIGWPYDLVVTDIESDGYGEDNPGFRCRELRFGLGRRPLYRVSMSGPELVLVKDADERWMPSRFAALGNLASGNVLQISRITEATREQVALTVENGSVRWFGGLAGVPVAVAKGITFSLAPVDIPGRRMYHYYLSVDSALDGSGTRALGVQREWLASEMIEYLEISAAGGEFDGAQQLFWEVR